MIKALTIHHSPFTTHHLLRSQTLHRVCHAAFIAWKLTVIIAISNSNKALQYKNPPADIDSISKILQPLIHCHHATGKAIRAAIKTSFKNLWIT